MRLLRLGPAGSEKLAALDDDDRAHDLTGIVESLVPTPENLQAIREAVTSGRLPELSTGQRVGAPIPRPGKIVCIGLNYRDHAAETGAAIPPEPVLFMKAPNTVVGPEDTVLVPRNSVKTDWEVELALVIGRTARYLDSAEDGLACIGGYAISHDVSEREFQIERGGTWDKGKNAETFNPFGPWIVPADQIEDPQNLALKLWVNGELKQDGKTSDMIFEVGEIVHYLSQFMVLEPGDVINTGTPAGVALGRPDPKPYLRAGDVVELEVEGLGRQRQVLEQA
ncbi:fumarylacetoacetate hydrolase family protein [Kineosporia babensis]|uniref:Fumarylacetoacetate hydrolase family protein n=1 Tax=Kineosporia babensis TaxID=499548 RepID=A0A9X1NLA6_9ACTN|nr:fumarylacetoacetate hydrolase family protein [Kineosporia babensis]MCD5316410.1 fumarylacetoacetate hydrolase family protein [Kineosporia babensis]